MSNTEVFETHADEEPPSPSSNDLVQYALHQAVSHRERYRFTDIRLPDVRDVRISLERRRITGSIYGRAYDTYRSFQFEQRDDMQQCIQNAMLDISPETPDPYGPDVRVMINEVPILFEPTNHAMVIGTHYESRSLISLESSGIVKYSQQRILLGGLAAMAWFLEQNAL